MYLEQGEVFPVEQQIIEFEGAQLLCIKASNGKVYTGVRKIVDGIGFSRGQANNQVEKVQKDLVLKRGARNFVFQYMEGSGGTQEVLAIEIEFLPLWLAKITLTPAMQRETPELTDKLISYQLRAKDVLASAFLKQPSYMINDNVERAKRWIEEEEDRRNKEIKVIQLEKKILEIEPKISYLDQILGSTKTLTITQIAADYGITAQVLNNELKDARIQRKVNGQWVLYHDYMGKGYTRSKTIPITRSNGDPDVTMSTQWTQKGRMLIHEILTEQGYKANLDKEYDDAR